MNPFADILGRLLEGRDVDASTPAPVVEPPRPVEWGLDDLVRRTEPRGDPSRGLWPRSIAAPRIAPEDCPHCAGVGSIFVTPEPGAYPVAVDCTCADLAKLVTSYNRIGLPPGFHAVTVEGTDWTFPTARVARKPVKAMVESWAPGAAGLCLFGSQGSGKNHMAALICTMIATRAPRDYGDGRGVRRPVVRAVDWPSLLQRVKAGFDSGKSETSITARYLNADLLWIDEVGMGQVTDYTSRVVEELLWSRLNSGQTTIITTNLPPDIDAAPAGWPRGKTMTAVLDSRVMSRMQDMAFVSMTGADYRQWRNR